MRKIFLLLAAVCNLVMAGAAASADNNPAVTQSYSADSSVLAGMLVELKSKPANTVTALTTKDLTKMLGVVVPVNDAPIVLTSPSPTAQQVLVATYGRYNMLVSDQAGSIRGGDYLTISALGGIGMKATTAQPEVVGQAAGDFNGSNSLGTVQLKKSTGGNAAVAIGSIPVNVRLIANPLYQKTSSALPGFLSKVANSVANKPVSTAKIYLGSFIILATMFLVGSMFYSGVKSGVTAIGRNPLAKQVIGRSLFRIVLTGLAVFIMGALMAYLILRI